MPVQKPVGATATFTAVVKNAEGVVLPDAVVTFTDDAADAPPVADATNPQVATVVGASIETVTVTASVEGSAGSITASDSVSFSDNTPATVVLTSS